MKEERMTFNITNDEGQEVECEVLFTFESDETGKNYMVYTDNTVDEEGNTKVEHRSERDKAPIEDSNRPQQPHRHQGRAGA